MLKFLQTTFKSILALPTKIQLINDLDQLIEDNQELIADNYQLMAENDGLKRDKQHLSKRIISYLKLRASTSENPGVAGAAYSIPVSSTRDDS